MKAITILCFFSVTLAGCASVGEMNNNRAERVLNRWESRITTDDVCGNEEYLSCVGITSQQCTDTSSAVGEHCRKFPKQILLKLGDNEGKEAYKTCVYTYHRNEIPDRIDTGKSACENKIKTLWW